MQAALVVLDGWGLSAAHLAATRDVWGHPEVEPPEGGRDAVLAADTPTVDRLADRGATGTMTVHGRRVGLPDGQMGNSEVGHVNIGAGRVVKQAYTRINDAIAADELADNGAIRRAFDHVESGGHVHLMGLVSDGGVHADQAHLHALVEAAAEAGVEAVTHAFTDGRDTPPTSGVDFLRELSAVADEQSTGQVATVSGRYYAMDRDENWARSRRAYDAVVHGDAQYEADSAVAAVEESYARGETDEFVEPTVVGDRPAVVDGDAVVVTNFRADRARQLVRLLGDVEPGDWPFVTDPPDVELVTMTEYDREFPFPVAFPPNEPVDTLGEVVAEAGLTQLRIAESEKYAHVTYFLNGGREVAFPGEIRRIVPSPDVPTYDQQPSMSAPEVTDTAIAVTEAEDPDLLVLNYANPDMVGHTGDFEAAVAAVEAVDEQLERLTDRVADAGAPLLVVADHGNADDMGTPADPHTAHTANPVPVIYRAPDGSDGGRSVRSGGSLCDVAPTLLELVDLPLPDVMTGTSLLES